MFVYIGTLVERWWKTLLLSWLAVLLVAMGIFHGWFNRLDLFEYKFPNWRGIAEDGEFAYLPQDMPSLVGERLLQRAFPQDLLKSSVVIVVRRISHPLTTEDERFIDETLKPRLEQIQEKFPTLIAGIKTYREPLMRKLLVSDDQKASLVIVAFTSEFLEWGNRPAVEAIENALYQELPQEKLIPAGLDLAMSGTATVGRDMIVANNESARRTELWTTILVITLLVLIYRAPVLALIPLLTVFMAVQISLVVVMYITQIPWFHFRVFMGMETYITVVVYGAGVDYCLFLIARYKEELDSGQGLKQSLTSTIEHVGAALVASAGTVICGIGMMIFAQFGKFREAGIAISLSLCIVLLASLTFTPALLRMAGRWAFWPYGRPEDIPAGEKRIAGTRVVNRLIERNRFQVMWEYTGHLLVKQPGKILAISLVLMLPFAFIGTYFHSYLSYGLLSELPTSRQSVRGAKAIQEHFPAGYAGPLTILVRNDELDFRSPLDESELSTGQRALDELVSPLIRHRKDLAIADVRYVTRPFGINARSQTEEGGDPAAEGADPPPKTGSKLFPGLSNRLRQQQERKIREKAQEYYISQEGEFAGHVARIDVIFSEDPFSRESINRLTEVENEMRKAQPQIMRGATTFWLVGPTASIRDLKVVTDRDQLKIDVLVLVAVFLILVVLLKKLAISLYLVVSVFFSYFVTLGVTFAVFWGMQPEFAGLDWKVPMFLFTILIAIGEDYNIFLMTRIEEEQLRYGPIEGVRVAMLRTGSIISSCGIIMAGTFCSLMAGTLVGMQQLGFALAFGVLLDTFVVRPILVPAYLIMLYGGRFGNLGRLLGHRAHPPVSSKVAPSFQASMDAQASVDA